MRPEGRTSRQCPICGSDCQVSIAVSKDQRCSIVGRMREFFYYRVACPSCAIVFEVSKVESCFFRMFPGRHELLGLRRRVRKSDGGMLPARADDYLRPAIIPPRRWSSGSPLQIRGERKGVPLRVEIQSDLIGVDLHLAFKHSRLVELAAKGLLFFLLTFWQCCRELFLPLLKTLFTPLEKVRNTTPQQSLPFLAETKIYEALEVVKEAEKTVQGLTDLSEERDRLVQ